MKMRNKTKLYLLLIILGVAVLIGDIALKDFFTKTAEGILSGIGSALMGLGAAGFLTGRMEEKYPQQMKQNQIELNDERNVMIRYRAQAVSGLVLQWCVLAAAWVCILMSGPLWITLAMVGVFLGKVFIEAALMAYYQNKM